MLNSAEYSAMFRLVQGWRFNAPTLKTIFDSVFTAKRRRKDLDRGLDGVFAVGRFDPKAADPLLPNQHRVDRYHELNDEIAANELAGVAYAGAVVLVMNNLLLALRDDLDASRDDWEKSEPLINGYSIGMILVAAANNFRHNDEWAKTRPPTPQQLLSIRVLASALGEAIASDGAGHRLSREICPEVLELLSGGDFERLAALFFAFANSLVKRREAATSKTVS